MFHPYCIYVWGCLRTMSSLLKTMNLSFVIEFLCLLEQKLSLFPWGPGSQCTWWSASVLCTLQMGSPVFSIHAVQFELYSTEDGNCGETLQAKVSLWCSLWAPLKIKHRAKPPAFLCSWLLKELAYLNASQTMSGSMKRSQDQDLGKLVSDLDSVDK